MVVMASCNVQVAAHDNALGSDVQVNFTLNETNYLTPHNLTLGIGNYRFTFPDEDQYGYPFAHCYIWYSSGSYKYIKARDFILSITFFNQSDDFKLKAYYHVEPYSDKHPTLIYVDFPVTPIKRGENFSVSVGIRNVKDLFAWELYAYYPKEIMRGLLISDTAFLNRINGAPYIFLVDNYGVNGYCTYPFILFGGNFTPYNDYNLTHGLIHVGSTIINSVREYPGITTTGPIVKIKFEKQSDGEIKFFVAQDNSRFYTFLLDSSLNEIPSVVSLVSDLTGSQIGFPDGKVDIKDVAMVSKNFGMTEENPNWDPWLDLTGAEYLSHDCIIDIKDVALVSKNFGKIFPK